MAGFRFPKMIRPLRVLCALTLMLLPLANCDCEDQVEAVNGNLVVNPPSIDMGDSYVGRLNLTILELGNDGTAKLTIQDIDIEPLANPSSDVEWIDTTGAAFSVVDMPETLAIDEVQPSRIGFTPPSQGAFGATLVIHSDDIDDPAVRVTIIGVGGKPAIEANPASVDFGVVNEGPGLSRIVLLTNVGYDVLHVSSLEVEGFDAAGNAIQTLAFSLADDAVTSVEIPPGESHQAEVFMYPNAESVAAAATDTLEGRLKTLSDADNVPELFVPLSGQANLAPIPVIVELITRRQEVKVSLGKEVTIDGNETTDPEGEDITFSWTLEGKPDASNAFLLSGPQGESCSIDSECSVEDGYRCVAGTSGARCRQSARTRVTPDVVGTYTVRMRATDARGAWAEADATILPRDFAVVLTWSTADDAACQQVSEQTCEALSPSERRLQCCGQTDLDLHLLRPEALLADYGICPMGCTVDNVDLCFEDSDENQSTCRQEGGDCSFANRYPDWGDPGRYDDPRLDIDDIRGNGPEVITLNNPPAGAYQAVVHFCTDRITEPTLATIDFYVKGELVYTAGPQRIDDEGSAWIGANMLRAGDIDDGVWTFVSVPNFFDESASVAVCDP
ncbi:MAG: choice-of-anchor D domain-containing protein [Deltaproteobacteria bacterium]|nr:choice-of-anchor D domain-containing protein [Deltaproteobacteria bacterium]